MIDKQTFIEIMNNIQKQNEIDTKVGEALELVCDSYCIYGTMNLYLASVEKLLSVIFEDTGEWISWWMYEKDYGKNSKMKAYDENKKVIPLTSASQLYKFLIDNMKAKK
jgi:hypothetical protein